MPELPEVETIRRGLEKTIRNKKIKAVEIRLPKIVSVGAKTVSNIRKASGKTANLFRQLLTGHKFIKIRRRSKMLILDLSGPLTLLIHLKMTGQLIYAKKSERKAVKTFNTPNSRTLTLPHKYTHVIFTFADGSHLYFNDLRQFGYLRLVKDEDVKNVKELNTYGAEPLSIDFTLDYLRGKAKARPKLSIKQFLIEPKVISGIGNIYSDEILFCAKILPNRRVRSLSNPDFATIYKCVPMILRKALKAQGSSVGDFFKVDGSEGTFKRQHKVYQRAGEACYDCGEIIEKIKLGGRTASYCPVCQK